MPLPPSKAIPYTRLFPVNTTDGHSLARLMRLEVLQLKVLKNAIFDEVTEYCVLLLGLVESMCKYEDANGGKQVQLFEKLEVIREGVVGNSLAFELAYWVSKLGRDCYFLTLFRLGKCLEANFNGISHPAFHRNITRADENATDLHMLNFSIVFSILARACLANRHFMTCWTGELVEKSKMTPSQSIMAAQCAPASISALLMLLNGALQVVLKCKSISDIKLTIDKQQQDRESLASTVSVLNLSLACMKHAAEKKSVEEKEFLQLESVQKTTQWLRNISLAMLCFTEGNASCALWYASHTRKEWFHREKEKLKGAAERLGETKMYADEEPKEMAVRFPKTFGDLTKTELYLETKSSAWTDWPVFEFRSDQNSVMAEYTASIQLIKS